MINLLRAFFYFIVLVLIQVWVLNNIYFLRMATPFLYLYFILKMPLGISRTSVVFFSFLIGLIIDLFSNTYGMHAAASTLIGFFREPLINILEGKELPESDLPSYRTFGYRGFLRYAAILIIIHHLTLFLIESFSFLDPLFLILRITACVATTMILIGIVEAFNIDIRNSGE